MQPALPVAAPIAAAKTSPLPPLSPGHAQALSSSQKSAQTHIFGGKTQP